MGSPAIFKADRTKLLSSKGLELKDGTHIDNDGVVNFIKPDVTKWQAGSYTAATRPSGSFTATPAGLTVTKTSSLGTGSMSLLFTKAVNNQQGSACVYEFDLPASPSKFQAAMLQIKCDYVVDSGTFAAGSTSTDSDLIFYIEEFNGIAWSVKEPSNFKLFSNATNIVSTDGGIFQTNSDTTKIRLIAYVASTTTSAFSLKADFSVSPQTSSTGAAVTDWVSYTPVLTAQTGTPTNATTSGRWRQVGDSIEVEARVEFTGNPAASGAWGGPLLSLPSGFTIDTTKKLSTYTGLGFLFDASPATFYSSLAGRDGNSFGPVQPSVITHTGTAPTLPIQVTNTYPFTWASGDSFNVTSKFPIQGWSSNTRISDGFEGRDVRARATRSSSLSVPNNTTTVTINSYSTPTYNTTSSLNSSSGVFTVPSSGYYNVGTFGVWAGGAGTISASFIIRLYKNGNFISDLARTDTVPAVHNASAIIVQNEDTIYFVAGDQIELRAWQNTGQTRSLDFAQFRIEKDDSGSQTIAASPVVAMSAQGAAAATITNTASVIIFNSKESDTHNAYNTTTGVFTAPESGFYSADWSVSAPSVNLSTSERFFSQLNKNGSSYRVGQRSNGIGTANAHYSQGSANSIYLKAGETLSVSATSSVSTAVGTSTTEAYFTVTKAGN